MKITIVKDYDAMSDVATTDVVEVLKNVEKPVLGLATGSTPVGLYKNLVKLNEEKEIDFSKVSSVNLDEYVGLTENHDQSYRYFMNNHLFNHVNIDKANTYVPNGSTTDFAKATADYDQLLDSFGQVDLQVLGLGANGHIGFNEPAEELSLNTHVVELKPETIDANARFFASKDDVPKKAITMGIASIMKAKKIIVLVSGAAKAEVLNTFNNDLISTLVPCSLLKLHPNVHLIVDEAAATYLK